MALAARQRRVRVLEALARRAKEFRTRHDIWPLRVPREPVALDEVIEDALGPERALFDERELRSRMLLQMEWTADPSPVRWETWVIALPTGLNLYCDSDDDETRILASGRRDAEGGGIDTFFLELLADSAGEQFGIEMSGGAPSRVRTSLTDRQFLIELFVDLFEVTRTEESVREALTAQNPTSRPSDDFRADVERWLDVVKR